MQRYHRSISVTVIFVLTVGMWHVVGSSLRLLLRKEVIQFASSSPYLELVNVTLLTFVVVGGTLFCWNMLRSPETAEWVVQSWIHGFGLIGLLLSAMAMFSSVQGHYLTAYWCVQVLPAVVVARGFTNVHFRTSEE